MASLRYIPALAAILALLTASACSDDEPVYADDNSSNNGANNGANNGDVNAGTNNASNNTGVNNTGTNNGSNNAVNNTGTNNAVNNAVNNTGTNNGSNNANNDPGALIGTPCSTMEECGDGFCILDVPGGYCSAFCAPNLPESCGADNTCLQADDSFICVAGCASDADCREDLACATWLARPFCGPVECRADAECGEGLTCSRGQCGDPEASIGDACEANAECPPGATCVQQIENENGPPTEFRDGYCLLPGCTTNDECRGGTCIRNEDGESFCLGLCTADDPCRPGYSCTSVDPGTADAPTVCVPGECVDDRDCGGRDRVCVNARCGTPDAQIGDPCREAVDCAPGDVCILPENDDTRGFNGGYCARIGCPTDTSGACGEGNVCVPVNAEGEGVCLKACEGDAECREGGLYVCRLAYPGLPEGLEACLPTICATAQDCPNGFQCEDQACVRR